MSTYEHTVKLKQERDKKDAQKGNTSSRTQVEVLSARNQSDNDITEPNTFKLHEQKKLPKIESTGNVQIKTQEINSEDENKSKFAYKNATFSNDQDKINPMSSINLFDEYNNVDYHPEAVFTTKRLFHHRTSHQNGLPCSNSETNNNYYIVNDENETSRESFSLGNVNPKANNQNKELFEKQSTSKIVRLPPLLPVTTSRNKKSKNTQYNKSDDDDQI